MVHAPARFILNSFLRQFSRIALGVCGVWQWGSRAILCAETMCGDLVTTSVGIDLGQFAIVLGFTRTVPILEYYTAVH